MPFQPGEVYRLQESRRPVIVVSREALNRGLYVVVVEVTTQRLDERRTLRNCVPFMAGQFGFDKDCVAQAESITFLKKTRLDLETGPIGNLSDEAMRDLVRAIGSVIAAECEPL